MRVYDRCKKELDTNKESKINGKNYELCSSCAEYISRHIETFNPKKKNILGRILNG